MEDIKLGPFLGMNNITPDHAVPKGFVRNIVNADVKGGKVSRRGGETKVYSALKPKGGFSCPAGSYFIEKGYIKKFLGTTASTIYTGINGTEYAWNYLNGVVYFSDGIVSLKIENDIARNWGMQVPSSPVIYGVSGTYGGGQYLAAICYVDADGVESGASEIVVVDLPDNTGIVFANLPTPIDPQVSYVRLYLSTPNGSELYHIADLTPGTLDYTITSGRYDGGNILEHTFVSPAPAGRIIRFHNGRAFVADSYGRVFYSDPLELDHFRRGANFLQFSAIVDIMEPVKGGIFFAYSNTTEFHAGDVEEGFNISSKFSYGGIFGTGSNVPNSDNVCWQSQRGMCIGSPGGEVKNIVEENVAPDSGTSGASLIKEQNGLRQFIVCIKQPTASPLAAKSWIDAEVARRGA